jgi:hypothetical protein
MVVVDAPADTEGDGATFVVDGSGYTAVDGSPADVVAADAGSGDTANGPDGLGAACPVISGGSGTSWSTGNFGTLGAYCFVTCDDITGWTCSSFDGRTVTVNGAVVDCGTTSLTKVGGQYQFEATAGAYDYATIVWWGTPQACTH